MTMAKEAKKDRKKGRRKGDARVGYHGSGHKGPYRRLSTPVAFNTLPIHPTAPLILRGIRVGLTPHLRKTNRSRGWFTSHLIMTSELCERAIDWAPIAQLPTYTKKSGHFPHLPTHWDTKRHNGCYSACHLVFPR
jgi:hypothetical protein